MPSKPVKKNRQGEGGGRPTKYKEDYPEKLLEHMSKGFPFETFAAVVKVSVRSLYEWENKHPKFSQAKKDGDMQIYLHYMRMGQGLALGKIKGNVTAWIFIMKNVCGWRDNAQTQIGINVGEGNNTKLSIDKDENDVPIYEVEVNDNGKFKRLKPRKVQ